MSRIYYQGKFYDYPLRALNALKNLGILESIRCVLSYFWVRFNPPKDQSSFENWVAARFGWRLYRIFFKTYTEKVWGISASDIDASWAAQRIKNLSLGGAIKNALRPRGHNSTEITSLIEQFNYPKLGPGMLWEKCAEKLRENGVKIQFGTKIRRVERYSEGKIKVTLTSGVAIEVDAIISSMPLNELVLLINPLLPQSVLTAAKNLKHRDFLTVALVVDEDIAFPDNWIYVHDPKVKVGRIQNFGSWSKDMVKPGFTCLGLEFFVSQDEKLWNLDDESLIELATKEIVSLGLANCDSVREGYVVRVPLAYPVYDGSYQNSLKVIREALKVNSPEILPVGRNGMHRYNNQDHSMYTAMLAVENLLFDAGHDLWAVNVEEEYLEEQLGNRKDTFVSGTGRAAPIKLKKN